MLAFLRAILDTVLPRKQRVARLETYSLQDLNIAPSAHEAYGIQITTLMSYRTRAVEDSIRALKYDRTRTAAYLLAEALAEYLREEIAHIRLFSQKSVLLVPVPLHGRRLQERSFNQVEVILQKLPGEFQDGRLSRVVRDAIIRTRDTPQQTRLSRTERLENVRNAFALSNTSAVQNAYIILIDDVTTTGATLAEAAKTLGDTSISVIALAHA